MTALPDILRGILVVVKGASGHELVFSYPPPTSLNPPERQKRVTPSVFGCAPRLLSTMLTPSSLVGHLYSVQFDDSLFISHPVRCLESTATVATSSMGDPVSGKRKTSKAIGLFNVVFVLDAATAHAHPHLTHTFHDHLAKLATALQHEQERIEFVSHEISRMRRTRDAWREANNVLAAEQAYVDACTGRTRGSGPAVPRAQMGNSASGTDALAGEDDEYATHGTANTGEDCEWMRDAPWLPAAPDVDPHALARHETAQHVLQLYQRLTDKVVDTCELALVLCQIYSGFAGIAQQTSARAGPRARRGVTVTLNGWLRLGFTLELPTPVLPVRPYHTMLLLDTPTTVLARLPRDASPSLRTLIAACNPLRSFRELSVDTGIPLRQIYRAARHLVWWGWGRVIHTITTRGLLVRNYTLDITACLCKEKLADSNTPIQLLTTMLQPFATPRTLAHHIRDAARHNHPANRQARELDITQSVVWMLRHNLIHQIHTYLLLVLPKPPPIDSPVLVSPPSSNADRTWPSLSPSSSQATTPSPPSSPVTSPFTTPPTTTTATTTTQVVASTEGGSPDSLTLSHSNSTLSLSLSLALTPSPGGPMVTRIRSPNAAAQQRAPAYHDDRDLTLIHSTVWSDLTASEQRFVRNHLPSSPAGADEETVSLFVRIMPLLRGDHHIQDILWKEGISLEQLEAALALTPDRIIRHNRAAPSTTPSPSSLLP